MKYDPLAKRNSNNSERHYSGRISTAVYVIVSYRHGDRIDRHEQLTSNNVSVEVSVIRRSTIFSQLSFRSIILIDSQENSFCAIVQIWLGKLDSLIMIHDEWEKTDVPSMAEKEVYIIINQIFFTTLLYFCSCRIVNQKSWILLMNLEYN